MKLFFDIETDGLKPTVVWVICAQDEYGKKYTLTNPTREDVEGLLSEVTEVIGHNIINYDVPALEDILGVSFEGIKQTDTLVMSRLYNPSLEGGHSLAKWGERLNFPKGDYSDWSALTPEMITYCEQDVAVTVKTYDWLAKELANSQGECLELEHKVQAAISQQMKNGWLFDERKAYMLTAKLQEKQMELEDKVHETFKPLPTFVKEITPKFKKDGSLSVVGLKFLGDDWVNVGGDFSRIDWPEFNLGSRRQIGIYLQKFGWKPEKFTETGQPIVDEKVLESVTDIPEAQLIAEWLLVQKRHAQVQSWIDAIEDDGRIHGYVNPIGAVTGRMTHAKPNCAQVPAVYSPYGKECRECWVVPPGYKLVGIDASGLELRMLAHYMKDEDYTREILEGDIHTANQKAAGLPTRDMAKTFIYAFLYGGGDARIGSIVGGTAKAGQDLKTKFLRNTPALGKLRDKVTTACKRGYLRGLDGRQIWIRSEHASLNSLLQSAGAVVMKKALDIFTQQATDLDYKLLGSIHDEYQIEAPEEQAEKVGALMVQSIQQAGVHFNMNCPLDGEYKIGNNWAETH